MLNTFPGHPACQYGIELHPRQSGLCLHRSSFPPCAVFLRSLKSEPHVNSSSVVITDFNLTMCHSEPISWVCDWGSQGPLLSRALYLG